MALQTAVSFKDNELEGIRYQLETVGYVEDTYVVTGVDDSPATVIPIDGKALTFTYPVPVDSTVTAFIQYAVYADAGTDDAVGGFNVVTANRIAAGDVTVDSAATAMTSGGATATLSYDADTTNQGVDVTLVGAASSDTTLVARIKLVCAKKGGFAKKYTT